MLHGFRDFINRGNVVDLAVAVIIGAAFTKIISSLTDDLLMPVIGWLVGDLDFSNYFVRLGPLPASYASSSSWCGRSRRRFRTRMFPLPPNRRTSPCSGKSGTSSGSGTGTKRRSLHINPPAPIWGSAGLARIWR